MRSHRSVTYVVAALVGCALTLSGAPSAVGQPNCRSSVVAGVETDTCVGNPDESDGLPGNPVRVEPEFCFGLGSGGCDD